MGAIEKACAKAGLGLSEIDLFEINEAFAIVPLIAIGQLGLDPDKVNVHGGAVAIGHPLGASGGRLVATLVRELQNRRARYGLATLCIAAVTGRPEKVIGMHFMNPVPVMKLVEVIRGLGTGDETFAVVRDLIGALGKEMAVAADYPGFIVNRILIPMINEAAFALYEGVASAEDIDKAMKLGTNQPMGPLTLADVIGLDTCLAIVNVLYDGFKDPKYRPSPLLVKMVEAGYLGRKNGRGFFTYAR